MERGIIIAVARDGHMNPVHWPRESLRQGVGDHHHIAHVPGFDPMLVPEIAVAEVIAEVDRHRHAIAELDERVEHGLTRVRKEGRKRALPYEDFTAAVPLDRQFKSEEHTSE